MGRPAPNLYIAREIKGNRFKISGGRPHGKVSWQVTGIRHDAYANANRILVEQEKTGAERGRYLYPEGFGHSEQDSVAAAASASPPTNIATEGASHR
jgi:trimeric autotransporter adhesin